ncbi:hypothetical protein NT05LI_0418, partial [Listeria ivanovii FSL F6-596]
GKIVYKFRKPIAKYGKKGAKWVGKTAKKAWGKVPKVQKIGRIKASGDKGKGYWGIRYSKKKNGKKTYKSWEFHTPHNGHGWHLQRNNYSKHNGKWRRSSKGTKRITLKKAKDRRSKKK